MTNSINNTHETTTDTQKTDVSSESDNNSYPESYKSTSIEDYNFNTSHNSYEHNPSVRIKEFISKNKLNQLIKSLTSFESYSFFSALLNSHLQNNESELFNEIRLFISQNNSSDNFYNCMRDFIEYHMDSNMVEKQISAIKYAFDTLDEGKNVYESFSNVEISIIDKTQPLLPKDEYKNLVPTNIYKLDFLSLANMHGRDDILDLFSENERKAMQFDSDYKEPMLQIKTSIKNDDVEEFCKTFISLENFEIIGESVFIAADANYLEPLSLIANFISKHDGWDHFYGSVTRLLKSAGLSDINVKTTLTSFKFIADVALGKTLTLSSIEQNIIDKSQPLLDKKEYLNAELSNDHGLDFFNLAILYSRNDILNLFSAKEIRDLMFKSLESDISPIDLMTFMQNQLKCFNVDQYKEILTPELIDYEVGPGQTHLDLLVDFPLIKDYVIKMTNDPFYKLIQDVESFEKVFADESKTYIAISSDFGIWSDSLLNAARLISKSNPQIEFILVTQKTIDATDGAIFEKIDAWMNPGSGDSYSSNGRNQFTKETWNMDQSVEQLYQTVLEAAKKHKFPVLGVCGGAQNAILNNNGSLQKIDGYNAPKEKHEITFEPGTLGHLLSLTKNELVEAFEKGILPEVKYLGETYHGYAAVNGKLGTNLKLDAVSEDGVPMAYSGSDEFISFNTQYHPEMHYINFESSEEGNINHQKAFLDNFVKLASLNHLYKAGEAHHPQEYLKALKSYISGEDIEMGKVELIQDYFSKLDIEAIPA